MQKKAYISILFIVTILFSYYYIEKVNESRHQNPSKTSSAVIVADDVWINFNSERYHFVEKGICLPYSNKGSISLFREENSDHHVDVFSGECAVGSKKNCTFLRRLSIGKSELAEKELPIDYIVDLEKNGDLKLTVLANEIKETLIVKDIPIKSITRGIPVPGPNNVSLEIHFPYPADLYNTLNLYVIPKYYSFEKMDIGLLMAEYMCSGVTAKFPESDEESTTLYIESFPYQMETGFFDIYITYKSNSGGLHSLYLRSAVEYVLQ